MDFVALDVETANADFSSICQIGVACYESGRMIDQWTTLVDPEDYFDPTNVSIHGIAEDMVSDSPTFPEIAVQVKTRLGGCITVCHTPFDRVALSQACSKYGLEEVTCTWLDSACVARRTWTQFARSGYGLQNVCATIGYQFRHHDALEDAKAAAHVLLAAMQASELDLLGWLMRVKQPIFGTGVAQPGSPEGPLYGEVLVFTGKLQMTRPEAAALVAKAGCEVRHGVTQKTTILVVGDQEPRRLAGYEKSSKHRKAEDLIRRGQGITLMTEKDFELLVRLDSRPVRHLEPGKTRKS
jgi:DNA polymerase III subunit epsilon